MSFVFSYKNNFTLQYITVTTFSLETRSEKRYCHNWYRMYEDRIVGGLLHIMSSFFPIINYNDLLNPSQIMSDLRQLPSLEEPIMNNGVVIQRVTRFHVCTIRKFF